MSRFHDIASIREIPPGELRSFIVEGRRVAIARTAEGFFATDDACPHRGGPLSEGDLRGCEIICPWHFWGFDLATGRHTGGSKFAVSTHEVRVEGDRLLIRLSPLVESPWMRP